MKQYLDLKHTEKILSTGGTVLVLDIGATIDAQAEAMLQALHSRSTGGIKSHLEILQKKGAEKFMSQFYVGYGHKSIGDCGNATVFVEGISMLAAKAIQDWRLYSGQESSTRYVDFSRQIFYDPTNTDHGKEILEGWRNFYLDIQTPVKDHLRKQFPFDPVTDMRLDEEESKAIGRYEKAIAARGFDITRAFLPAGATTNIAWHMNLRQFADELLVLRQHPLAEVKDIAEVVEEALVDMYPESFGHKRYKKTEEYNALWMNEDYYYSNVTCSDFSMTNNSIDIDLLRQYKKYLENRPPKTELPMCVAECGTVQFEFLLDYGSFRDIQRHRAVVQRMPLLGLDHGFESWYLDAMPHSEAERARGFIASQVEKIKALALSKTEMQYFIPMGYRIANRLTGDLKALVYLAELRSTRFVHPTLVRRAQQMAHALKNAFAHEGLVLHLDDEPNRFDVQRGDHDIIVKS